MFKIKLMKVIHILNRCGFFVENNLIFFIFIRYKRKLNAIKFIGIGV